MEIVKPHRQKSREVTTDDIARVLSAVPDMRTLFGPRTVALAHAQVDDRDPLRFFVLAGQWLEHRQIIIVNPRITRAGKQLVESLEGCHTYQDRASIIKNRKRLLTVEYQVIRDGKLSEYLPEDLKNFLAFVFQHELDHMDAIYCYD